jgi:glycosyltransferase involved in cell wall biosynthesis
MKISCAVIVYNEISLIKGFVSHVLSWADELSIVDGGSTDGTVDVIKSFNINPIISQQPEDMSTFNFAVQKNIAIDNASGDWIVLLDVDEFLCDKLVADLHSKLEECGIESKGIMLKRRNLLDSKPYTVEDHLRIIRNKHGIRYNVRHNLHEAININSFITLPPEYYILHDKSTIRQEKQNEFYKINFYDTGKFKF